MLDITKASKIFDIDIKFDKFNTEEFIRFDTKIKETNSFLKDLKKETENLQEVLRGAFGILDNPFNISIETDISLCIDKLEKILRYKLNYENILEEHILYPKRRYIYYNFESITDISKNYVVKFFNECKKITTEYEEILKRRDEILEKYLGFDETKHYKVKGYLNEGYSNRYVKAIPNKTFLYINCYYFKYWTLAKETKRILANVETTGHYRDILMQVYPHLFI